MCSSITRKHKYCKQAEVSEVVQKPEEKVYPLTHPPLTHAKEVQLADIYRYM